MNRVPGEIRLTFVILLVCGSLACLGCGSRSSRVRLQDERARTLLERHHPELVARAHAAEANADRFEAEGDHDGAGDFETIARLHYQLAEVLDETERLQQHHAELQQQLDEDLALYAGYMQQREQLAFDAEFRDVTRAAQDEAHRAFAIAEQDEHRRLRRRRTEVMGARMNAARALLERALWLAAGAAAMGRTGDAPALAAAAAEQRAIRALSDAPEAIARARHAHADALSRLRQARNSQEHPLTSRACAELVAAALSGDFAASLQDDGLRVLEVAPRQAPQLAALLSNAAHASNAPNTPVLAYPRQMQRALIRAGMEETQVWIGPTAGPSVWIPGCAPERP